MWKFKISFVVRETKTERDIAVWERELEFEKYPDNSEISDRLNRISLPPGCHIFGNAKVEEISSK
ncbi:hypothetical protein DN752_17855 [Echinicola strongylocentroti]|uniref:Uncharacterized protein n=1 Tax=Echinicola strongylocentroti TaxID=1795355 RepID=A0A2Z4ILN5_9BACT|nr:hypothetical protein [Echinicola strongylocentroti]AWW31845.1 hypothetical protein DN752_17855 [Echinicola strongylocentroti]